MQVSEKGQRIYFTTGFTATDKQFDNEVGRFFQGRGVRPFNVERKEEGGNLKTYSNKEANDKLAEIENRARDILQSYSENKVDWTLEMFKEEYANKPKRDYFLAFMEGIVEAEYRERGQYSTADTVKYTIKALRRYDKNIEKRTFQEITAKYLEGFESFSKKEGALPATISIRDRVIKRVFNIAIRDKVIPREVYPFSSGSDDGKYKIPQPKLTKTNEFLPTESLKKLANTTFMDPTMERDRHLFLFSFYCMGINWKDMALLKKSNFMKTMTIHGEEILVLRYQRAKTQGEFEIMVTPKIMDELQWFKENTKLYKDYVLPIIIKDIKPENLTAYIGQKRKRFNAKLKEIAKALDLPESQLNMTSYHARHSFAMALQEKGKSVEIISQALGHQSVETTKHYLQKFSTTRMAEETDIDLSE